jgi:hypothetical protein
MRVGPSESPCGCPGRRPSGRRRAAPAAVPRRVRSPAPPVHGRWRPSRAEHRCASRATGRGSFEPCDRGPCPLLVGGGTVGSSAPQGSALLGAPQRPIGLAGREQLTGLGSQRGETGGVDGVRSGDQPVSTRFAHEDGRGPAGCPVRFEQSAQPPDVRVQGSKSTAACQCYSHAAPRTVSQLGVGPMTVGSRIGSVHRRRVSLGRKSVPASESGRQR